MHRKKSQEKGFSGITQLVAIRPTRECAPKTASSPSLLLFSIRPYSLPVKEDLNQLNRKNLISPASLSKTQNQQFIPGNIFPHCIEFYNI